MHFKKWFFKEESQSTVNLDSYTNSMDELLKDYIRYYKDRQSEIDNLHDDKTSLHNIIQSYPNAKNLMASIGHKDFDFQHNRLYNWMKRNDFHLDSHFRKAWQKIDDHNIKATKSFGLENTIADLKSSYEENIKKTQENMHIALNIINQAISRINGWGNSPIMVEAEPSNDEYGKRTFEPSRYMSIYVGGVLFTASMDDNNNIVDIDDIIEDDGDDFETAIIKKDYYSLINELKNPGSSSKGKILTLYTARPTKDREFYNNTNYLPINLFLTNSASHAEGLAHDLSSGEIRDVWKVRIDSQYLTQTLDGSVKYYMVTTDKAPIKTISLY